jgi:hypothetical protein
MAATTFLLQLGFIVKGIIFINKIIGSTAWMAHGIKCLVFLMRPVHFKPLSARRNIKSGFHSNPIRLISHTDPEVCPRTE